MAPGEYARVPVWRDQTTWLASLRASLQTPAGEEARAAAHVAGDTLLLVAAADAAAADLATGRGVATAHDTVAALLGMSGKTVQRARALMEALGHAVTVFAGRYLTVAERQSARRQHGGPQLRAASTRALTHPRNVPPVEDVQLPRRGNPSPSSHDSEKTPRRARTRRKAAPKPPIPIGVQRLAAQLDRRMPWLTRQRHIGTLGRMLARHGLTVDAGWSAELVLHQLQRYLRDTGRTVPDPGDQRNPLGYLQHLLAAATLQPQPQPPTLPAAAKRRPSSWELEAAARRRELAAEDPARRVAAITRLRAEMAADGIPRSRGRRR